MKLLDKFLFYLRMKIKIYNPTEPLTTGLLLEILDRAINEKAMIGMVEDKEEISSQDTIDAPEA